MSKVILYMAMSVDGYIARRDGSVDWLVTDVDIGKEHSTETFLQTVDTIFMGRKSYEQMLTFGDWELSEKRTYVFTRSQLEVSTPNTEVLHDLSGVDAIIKKAGKDIWLFGGGTLNTAFLERDLIDSLQLFVQPDVIGEGISLFEGAKSTLKSFHHESCKALNGGFTYLSLTKS